MRAACWQRATTKATAARAQAGSTRPLATQVAREDTSATAGISTSASSAVLLGHAAYSLATHAGPWQAQHARREDSHRERARKRRARKRERERPVAPGEVAGGAEIAALEQPCAETRAAAAWGSG